MKVLLINHTCGIGSTGRICAEIAENFIANGDEAIVAYGRGNVPEQYKSICHRFGSNLNLYWHAAYTRLTDNHGFASKHATREFLKWADEYDPDLLWLHNIHGYYINIEMLFDWIKARPQMKVNWTLHDCWAFTGHCTNFLMAGCNLWKDGCNNCPQKKEYPASGLIDSSRKNYLRKRELFTGVSEMELITPSKWLADLVEQSFLKEYPVKVQYNTVDVSVFKPTKGAFKSVYGIEEKKIILGVSNVWQESKGVNDFFRLAEMLDDRYVILMIGLSAKQIKFYTRNIDGATSKIGKATIKEVEHKGEYNIEYSYQEILRTPHGIAIPQSLGCMYQAITGVSYDARNRASGKCKVFMFNRTDSTKELAEIYTAADIYCNLTREDNYPTTNLEAKACGTWVITYDTGGAKETLLD